MAAPGQEVIIGALRDASFGPVLMVGLGGVFVEVLKDVSFAVAPLSERDAERMLESIKGIKLLKGVRGESPRDLEALKRLLLKLSAHDCREPGNRRTGSQSGDRARKRPQRG
jgi:acyl-CoA synthetase (NDP forming)